MVTGWLRDGYGVVAGWSRGVFLVVTGYRVVTKKFQGGYGLVMGWKRGGNRWGLRFLVMMIKEIRIWPALCLS